MNILLVDDEPIFIDKLRRIIEEYDRENGNDIRIIGEAYSGQEAIAIISRTPPDLIFTDIKMSNMNGIELSKLLQQEHPDIAVAIISGYPSFDYVREAMRANVTEYLLKPIEPTMVKELLHRIRPRVSHKKYRLSQERLLNLIESQENNAVACLPVSDTRQPARDYACYRVLAVQKPETVNHRDRLFLEQSMNVHEELILRLQGRLGPLGSAWILNSQDRRSQILIVGLQNSDEPLLKEITDIIRSYFSYDGIPISIAIGREIRDHSDLKQEIQLLLITLSQRIVIGSAQLIDASQKAIASQSAYTQVSNQLETKLVSLIAKKNGPALSKELSQLFRVWKSEQCPSVYIEKNMSRIIYLIERNLLTPNAMVGKMLEDRIKEIIYTAASFEEAARYCWEVMTDLLRVPSGASGHQDAGFLFERIQDYLQAHLNEQIGLTELNGIFKVSNTYLCNLFRNYANASFVEYFTTLRMEKAKTLIRDHPDMMLKDIAELVGYRDHHYFSRVFKIITGQTPSEYKSQF